MSDLDPKALSAAVNVAVATNANSDGLTWAEYGRLHTARSHHFRVVEAAIRAYLAARREAGPTERQIRDIDAALFEHWPNARKAAIAMHRAMLSAISEGS